MSPAARALVVWLVATVVVTSSATAGQPVAAAPAAAELVSVLPNPTADGDAGEHLVVVFPTPTNVTGWSLADGETIVRFPNRTLSGRVVVSTEPEAVTAPSAEGSVVGLSGHLALANAGETVELRSPEGVVDTVSYENAPEGKRYVRTDGEGWSWRVPGRTDLPVVTARDVPATLFVLPDAPSVPVGAIESARERVFLGAYTFASERVATALCDAEARGVRVEVLVEGEPVGGVTTRQVRALDDLLACGVSVTAIGGPGDRYGVHHAKYAVVDDRALVLSENWKPAGSGGRSSRGWGVLLDSPAVADALAETFEADAGFRDARPWRVARNEVDPVEEPPANRSFPSRFEPTSVEVDRVDLLVTPDNAEGGLVEVIDDAERAVAVQQVSIGGLDGPFANATVGAARRGVPARILLSGAWYVAEDNRELARNLNALGRHERLPLSARLVTPRSRFQKSHVKALLVDGEVAVVGSLNWNAYAARENREVVVVLHDEAAATYYGRVFEADWRGGTWRLPVGFGASVALAATAAALVLSRRVRFEGSGAGGLADPVEPPRRVD